MTDFSVKTATIITRSNTSLDIKDIILEYNIYESVNASCLTASFVIQDSNNLLEIYDIFGQEEFILEIGNDSENLYRLNLYIFSITSRAMHQKKQTYIINCCSKELIRNESTRVYQRFKNLKAEEIIDIVLNQYLKVGTKEVKFDPTVYNLNFVSPSWRCFDLISWVQQRTVPSQYEKSAGYLFYETLDNSYNFRSIDVLISQLPKYTTPFTYLQGNTRVDGLGEKFRIKSFSSPKPFDLLTNSRIGLYSHTNMNLDINKRKLFSDVLSMDEYFETNAHLNPQKPYHSDDIFKLTARPTRIIFKPFLSDTWSDSEKTLNTDTINSNIAKTALRHNLLKTNTLEIQIEGNFDLRAGDVVTVNIPSPAATLDRVQSDKRLSGNYLVHSIRHILTKKVELTSVVTLVRDSYAGKAAQDITVPNQPFNYLGTNKQNEEQS